jgi:hypothetical protein
MNGEIENLPNNGEKTKGETDEIWEREKLSNPVDCP